jgi:hypothetical protein
VKYHEATATISPCGKYRYDLTRTWDVEQPTVVFCMLNPSTADGDKDDPTIRRCVAYAKAWGYGRLVVVNLFAYRATDPDELKSAPDQVGPENDEYIRRHATGSVVVAAWGANVLKPTSGSLRPRSIHVARLIDEVGDIRCLGLTRDGQPKHPLYLKRDAMPLLYPGDGTCPPDVMQCGHPNIPANFGRHFGCVACDSGAKPLIPAEPIEPEPVAVPDSDRAGRVEAKCEIHNCDCIRGMAERLAPDSVHLTVTSIPFEELFTYSGKLEDVGNNGSTVDIRAGRFALNMRFVVKQLFRVTAPGCVCCIHIQQLLAYKNQHGFMGRRDFRAAVIDVFSAGEFLWVGEFAIAKNPQAMAQRLSLHSLQFKTGYARSSTSLVPAPNDYVLIFQKPGEVAVPVRPFRYGKNKSGWIEPEGTGPFFPEWVRDAHGIWTDILETDVLDGYRSARESDQEKHVCPLQLEVIRRLVRLYSNPIEIQPGVTVLDPFMGIGSTAWVALNGPTQQGYTAGAQRNVVGFELKESYHAQALANVAKLRERQRKERTQVTLFDGVTA